MLGQWWRRQRQLAQPWQQQRYIVLDTETSGLDPQQDKLLALAWIELRPPLLDFSSTAYHVFATADRDLKQSPVVHGLVQRDFDSHSDSAQALQQLQQVLQGAVLVCHHIQLDWQFINRAAQQHQLTLQPVALIDTLQLEARRLRNQQHQLQRGSLTLAQCRARYHLPEYAAHHALSDAIACAELFLAQAYRFAGRVNVPVREFVTK
jgi:DNA polymerase-3 subunit epsilon